MTQIKQVGSLHSGTHIRTSVLLFCSLGYGILLCWLSWLKFQRAAVGTIAMHCQQTPLWCTTLGAANKLKHQEASCIFFPVVLQILLSDLAPSLFYSANRLTGGLLSALLSTDNTMACPLHYDALHGGAHKLQHLVASYIWLSHGITNAEVIYSTLVQTQTHFLTR